MLRVLGAAMVLLAAITAIRQYKRFVGKRERQYSCILDFLTGLERHISTTVASVDKYMSLRGDDELSSVGFYERYADCGSLHGAYLEIKDGLYVSDETSALLEGYFLSFGRGYADAELRSLRECVSALRTQMQQALEEDERSVRVTSVFAVAIAMGIVILLI